jgi:hypothetical protein
VVAVWGEYYRHSQPFAGIIGQGWCFSVGLSPFCHIINKEASSTWAIRYGYKSLLFWQKRQHVDRILREAIEIELHPDNMNREDSFSVSWAWMPLICDLREWRLSHIEVSTPSSGP